MVLEFYLIASLTVGNNMPAIYLVTSLLLVMFFVRNYQGVQKRVYARIFVILFFCGFITSVVYPGLATEIANFFGIGRGSDFIFYNFIIFGLGLIGLLYKKIINLERRLLDLNRQISINEAFYEKNTE